MGFDAKQYASVKSTVLDKDVMFHIMYITNISKSILNQLDDWNEFDNPNTVSVDRISNSKRTGQRVIREVDMEEGANFVVTLDKYKLLLRDEVNNFSYGYEFDHPLTFLRDSNYKDSPLPIKLGGRLIIKKGTPVLSGVLMLSNKNCQYLGLSPNDGELIQQLNDGIIKKNIELLKKQLEV